MAPFLRIFPLTVDVLFNAALSTGPLSTSELGREVHTVGGKEGTPRDGGREAYSPGIPQGVHWWVYLPSSLPWVYNGGYTSHMPPYYPL